MNPPTTLREWRQLTWQLGHDLGVLEDRARALGADDLARRCAATRERVSAHRFTIAVVGAFKRGKSTFINALIGRPVLPADVAPTTATLHRIRFGLTPTVTLHHHDGQVRCVPVEALAEHGTMWTDESAARAATIREVVVHHPVRFCRNDVDILDTPGLSDDAALTGVTLGVLPEVDAAIFVMMGDSPLSESEGRFVDALHAQGLTDVVYVLGAMDRIRRPEDRARLVASVEDRLAARLGARPTVYPVSARDALEARMSGDAEALAASGIPALEAALEALLTEADRVGLRRRLEALGALATELAGLVPPAAVRIDPSAEIARLDALLHAAEGAIDRWRAGLGDAAARVVVGSEDAARRWPVTVRNTTHAQLPRVQFGARWAEGWDGFCRTVATALTQSIEAAARGWAAKIAANAEMALDAAGSARALHTAAATVVGFTETQLAALGHTGSAMGVPPLGAAGDPLDVVRFVAAMTPDEARVLDALSDPAIRDALLRYDRKTGFDRLLALDFAGLAGQWVSMVAPRLDVVVEAHLRASPVMAAVQAQLDEAVRGRLAQVAPVTAALRRARAECVAFAERTRAREDRHAEEQARAQAEIHTIAERARAAAATL